MKTAAIVYHHRKGSVNTSLELPAYQSLLFQLFWLLRYMIRVHTTWSVKLLIASKNGSTIFQARQTGSFFITKHLVEQRGHGNQLSGVTNCPLAIKELFHERMWVAP